MEEGNYSYCSTSATIEAWQSTTFELDFNGQVLVQIRRSGRNNAEGVAFHDAVSQNSRIW
jgi:hypothetical protein